MRYYDLVDKVCTENGWTLNCFSPLEISNEQTGAVATLEAAEVMIEKFFVDGGYDD